MGARNANAPLGRIMNELRAECYAARPSRKKRFAIGRFWPIPIATQHRSRQRAESSRSSAGRRCDSESFRRQANALEDPHCSDARRTRSRGARGQRGSGRGDAVARCNTRRCLSRSISTATELARRRAQIEHFLTRIRVPEPLHVDPRRPLDITAVGGRWSLYLLDPDDPDARTVDWRSALVQQLTERIGTASRRTGPKRALAGC